VGRPRRKRPATARLRVSVGRSPTRDGDLRSARDAIERAVGAVNRVESWCAESLDPGSARRTRKSDVSRGIRIGCERQRSVRARAPRSDVRAVGAGHTGHVTRSTTRMARNSLTEDVDLALRADRIRARAAFESRARTALNARSRFTPDSRSIRARFAPDSRPIRARFAPDSRPIRARIAPESRPIRARIAPDSRPIRARFAPESRSIRAPHRAVHDSQFAASRRPPATAGSRAPVAVRCCPRSVPACRPRVSRNAG